MKNCIIAVYILITLSFAGIVDGVDQTFCKEKHAALANVLVGALWPVTMPILAIASLSKEGYLCKDQK